MFENNVSIFIFLPTILLCPKTLFSVTTEFEYAKAKTCMNLCCADGATVEQVLTTVIQGCSDLPDPSSQKVCFSKLIIFNSHRFSL